VRIVATARDGARVECCGPRRAVPQLSAQQVSAARSAIAGPTPGDSAMLAGLRGDGGDTSLGGQGARPVVKRAQSSPSSARICAAFTFSARGKDMTPSMRSGAKLNLRKLHAETMGYVEHARKTLGGPALQRLARTRPQPPSVEGPRPFADLGETGSGSEECPKRQKAMASARSVEPFESRLADRFGARTTLPTPTAVPL